MTIKWEYFELLYRAHQSFGELRCLAKITEEHNVPEKLKKCELRRLPNYLAVVWLYLRNICL